MSPPEFHNAALAVYRQQVAAASNPVSYLRTAIGARLGVDGLDAFRATPQQLFSECLSAALEIHAESNTNFTQCTWLDAIDKLLEAGRGNASQIWPVISIGIAGVEALGGPPKISSSPHSIFNDTLMLVLSKNYRAVRFSAYNEGAAFQIVRTQRDDAFRPEFGILSLGAPVVTFDADVPITQFYNVAHELSHIALLGDTYIRSKGGIDATAATFLAAEESLIGLDLLVMYELNAHGVEFHAAECFRGIEPGMQHSVPVSLATIAAKSPTLIRRRQRELKAHAARESGLGDPLSKWMARRCHQLTDIDQWVPRNARKKHIEGSIEIANRVCDPLFAHLVSFIPVDPTHLSHELKAVASEWGQGDMVFGIDVPELCAQRRSVEVKRWMLRQRLIRLTEAFVYLCGIAPERRDSGLDFVRDLMVRFAPYAARGAWATSEIAPIQQSIDAIDSIALDFLKPAFGTRSEELLTNAITPLTELV